MCTALDGATVQCQESTGMGEVCVNEVQNKAQAQSAGAAASA